jgi:uncharacterized protein
VSGVLDWFDRPGPDGAAGLRFSCTQCGNCCSGPPGYVRFTTEEAERIAGFLGVSLERFIADYTHETRAGRSIKDVKTSRGWDCVFLDRESVPGRAVCGVYEHRPEQCRTWPFWPSIVASRKRWDDTSRTCPGIGRGRLHPPDVVRLTRDRVDI